MPQGGLATLDDDAAIAEIANGAMLKQISARYNVVKSALYKRLSKHPDYKQAIELQAHSFVEDAMQDVMECDADTVNIARARVDAAFKYAKAHNPAYADKQQVTHEVGVTLAIPAAKAMAELLDAVAKTPNAALLRPNERVIEHDGDEQVIDS